MKNPAIRELSELTRRSRETVETVEFRVTVYHRAKAAVLMRILAGTA
jgi:hypothetical protein